MSLIYLDLGCSTGKTVQDFLDRKSFLPELADQCDGIRAFDPIRHSDWKQVEDSYHNVEFYECAVSTATGHSFISLNEDPNLRTLVEKNANFEEIGVERARVKVIDFPRWLQQNLKFEDTIICKIDIEGSEYELLELLILTKDKYRNPLIGWFNYLFVEFHSFCMKEEYKEPFNLREEWIRQKCLIPIQSYKIAS